ncbi:MAG: serine dehydratase [Spirochaetaceae bacterium]|jgi:L-serine dehydratase|nr:serine dehydratase [Spirochaetaceae bacterium]
MPKENIPIFEICGPVMIGPSSSHTAGVARIAYLVRKMYAAEPGRAVVSFYGSLAATWKGHGSGDAVIAGLLGIPPEDERLSRGGEILRDMQMAGTGFPIDIRAIAELPPSWHPNSLVIELFDEEVAARKTEARKTEAREAEARETEGREAGDPPPARNPGSPLVIRAASIGGGSIRIDEIDGYQVSLSGELDAILVLHHDEIGVIAIVSHILAAERINIAGTSSHRKEKGDEALLLVETDGPVPKSVTNLIRDLPPIYRVIRVPSLERL